MFELVVPPVYMQYLGSASPLAEHFALLGRLLLGDKTLVEAIGLSKLLDNLSGSQSPPDESQSEGEQRKRQLPTTFITDIKSYFRSLTAVIRQSSGDPASIARWSFERSLWVNRWMDVSALDK